MTLFQSLSQHEICKGLCKLTWKLTSLILLNRGETDSSNIQPFSTNTLNVTQSLPGAGTAWNDTAILQSKNQSTPSDYLLSLLESRDLSQSNMFQLTSFPADPSSPV